MAWTHKLKHLGPGLLFAGAAIGVSHLVQSTRAGADFGLGLIWIIVIAHLFKYPFFQYGPKYSAATGEDLLDGYRKLGKPALWIYIIITFASMFTIQAAVTIVTAGLATTLFGISNDISIWSVIITLVCAAILKIGRYSFLDKLMKVIIVTLALSTVAALVFASTNLQANLEWEQVLPADTIGIAFLIALMGWMPAPIDISIWHSLWAIEKKKGSHDISPKESLFDFNVGYIGAMILGICFLCLGAFVMFGTGESFSPKGAVFASQVIGMYTASLGNWAFILIGIATFTTMFSTTITTLDASPRSMAKACQLVFKKHGFLNYNLWLTILVAGTVIILFYLLSEMATLVEIATVLSFLTGPFYAILNYKLIISKHTPEAFRPGMWMRILSITGIVFLVVFGIYFLFTIAMF